MPGLPRSWQPVSREQGDTAVHPTSGTGPAERLLAQPWTPAPASAGGRPTTCSGPGTKPTSAPLGYCPELPGHQAPGPGAPGAPALDSNRQRRPPRGLGGTSWRGKIDPEASPPGRRGAAAPGPEQGAGWGLSMTLRPPPQGGLARKQRPQDALRHTVALVTKLGAAASTHWSLTTRCSPTRVTTCCELRTDLTRGRAHARNTCTQHTPTCTYTRVHIPHMCTHTPAHAQACMYHTRTHLHTYITHAHTYIYTHIHIQDNGTPTHPRAHTHAHTPTHTQPANARGNGAKRRRQAALGERYSLFYSSSHSFPVNLTLFPN